MKFNKLYEATKNKIEAKEITVRVGSNLGKKYTFKIKYPKRFDKMGIDPRELVINNVQGKSSETINDKMKYLAKEFGFEYTTTQTGIDEGYSQKTKEFVAKFGLNRKEVKGVMQQHKALKDKGILSGDEGNIDKFKSYDDLKNIIHQNKGKKTKSELKQSSKTILNNDRWKIVIPKTYESSCKLGTGTKWCTAAKTPDKWEQYKNDGVTLYYIHDKTKTKEDEPQFYKFAVAVTDDGTITEIRDAQDNDVSMKAFEGLTKLDKSLFKPDND